MIRYRLAAQVEPPVAFVLAGGASFGSIQVGMLRALADSDLRPDLIVGTSVGSLNGAVLAEDPEAAPIRLTELWSTVTRADIFGGVISAAVNVAARTPAVVSNDGLKSFISRAIAARDFADLQVPHTAMATDFDRGTPVPLREGELISALLASAAIPLVFPTVPRDGKRLVDGGLVANVPIGEAIAQGAKTVVVLDCGFTVFPPDQDDSSTGRLLRTAAIMVAQQVRRDFERAEGATILYLPGPWPAEIRPDDFSRSIALADAAEELSRAWLETLRVEGPGRYGYAPSDALGERKVKLSNQAKALVAEAGVDPAELEHDGAAGGPTLKA